MCIRDSLMTVPPLFRAAGVQAHPYVAAVLPAGAERDAEPPGGFAVADIVVEMCIRDSFTGKSFEAKEVDCWCTGDRTCRFEVKPATE